MVGDKHLVEMKTPNREGGSMGKEANTVDEKEDKETIEEAIIDT